MVQQYKALWSIPNAGPSVSTFHAQASAPGTAQAFANNVRAFFLSLSSTLPNDVTVSFESEVLTLNTATGVLEGSVPVTAPAGVTGSGAGAWAGGTGLRVVWNTGDIVSGRRVRGATFIVPADGDSFGSDGRVLPAVIAGIQTPAAALISAGQAASAEMQVWSRPRAAYTKPDGTAVPARSGSVHDWLTATVPPVAATLRGRKY